jgi:cobalt/nickel transport protein
MRHFPVVLVLLLLLPSLSVATTGLILPSDDIISQGEPSTLDLQIRTFDPRQHRFDELVKPKRVGVQSLGEQAELLSSLKPAQEQNVTTWTAGYAVKRPGDYTFHAEFAPRWDAKDEQFVVHNTKLCVNALGLEEGWDEPVGLEAEIVPLSRPYGLATGSLFSGQVLLKGEPAPYVLIEIIALGTAPDSPPTGKAPAAPYLVQKVRADANGVFHATMPRPGWWGFAAALDADWTLTRNGAEGPVAIVTSYWVLTRDL